MIDFQQIEDCNCAHPKCMGFKSWEPDAFMIEIHGDSTPVFQCDGSRFESEQDI